MKHAHDYRIDRLRLLACFSVVMLHSSYGTGSGDLALNAMFRFSVPVFVIISGYFMFPSAPRFSAIWNKLYRLFLKMMLCSGVYLLYSLLRGNGLPSKPIHYLLSEPIHLWYLYTTMGLYLLTPALAPFVRSADKKEYRYALVLCFLLGSCALTLERLDWIQLFSVLLGKSNLPVAIGFIGLYLLGGYFRKFGIHRRFWLIAWILSTAISVAASTSPLSEQLLSFLSPNVVISGCACFVVLMAMPDIPDRFRRLLRGAAECTMGVYLFHMMLSDLITPYIGLSHQIMGGAAAMALRGICTFTLSLVMVWILRKIPLLRTWML